MKRGIPALRILQPAQNICNGFEAQLNAEPVQGKEVVNRFGIGGHELTGRREKGRGTLCQEYVHAIRHP